ncbi:MAG: hypothetical protein FWG81_04415 [Betaproteobacteria bacterium]|nr:hypothetical protein [Betaproteobacteria bacterium]
MRRKRLPPQVTEAALLRYSRHTLLNELGVAGGSVFGQLGVVEFAPAAVN